VIQLIILRSVCFCFISSTTTSDAPFCWKTGTLDSDAIASDTVHCHLHGDATQQKLAKLYVAEVSVFYRRTQEDADPLTIQRFHHSRPLREKAPTCLSG
jgi:hypothetical protein